MLAALAGGGHTEYWKELALGPSILYVTPFALLLLAIAILPLALPHWWEHNRNKAVVAAIFGLPIVLVFAIHQDFVSLGHQALDYAAFLTLLTALFIISGGIYVRGSLAGTPLVNTVFLAIGALLASFLGTTGASMVLIRPLLRANQRRQRKTHVVIFFIFIVSNMGGLLTPLGDPPLYLGFLKGVPFEWTLFRLWPQWAVINGVLLFLFHLLDEYQFNKEDVETRGSLVEDVQSRQPFGIDGRHNFFFLAGVVAVIFASGRFLVPWLGDIASKFAQILAMAALAGLSYGFTAKKVRVDNSFSWGPIVEVGVLFAGIFAAMLPALLLLNAKGPSFGLTRQWQFFWMSGGLSSFLDNAPTYMTFSSLAAGTFGISQDELGKLAAHPEGALLLKAVSCGAVFMGANTYIGNAPNFMVKSIAESAKVKMPSFFGYMAWSIGVLIPLFAGITFLFFRG